MPRLAPALLALAMVATACRHRAPPGPALPPFIPTTIALLPLENATASVEAAKQLRSKLHERLPPKGYRLMPFSDIDARLDGMGIQLAGQLKGVDPAELRAKLGADMMLTGTLFKQSVEASARGALLGSVNNRRVEAELVLVDLRTGREVWRDRRTVVGGSDRAVSLLQSATGTFAHEQEELARILIAALPECPRQKPGSATGSAPSP